MDTAGVDAATSARPVQSKRRNASKMENHGLQLVVHATVSFTHEGLKVSLTSLLQHSINRKVVVHL
jgi:hypothetical protein